LSRIDVEVALASVALAATFGSASVAGPLVYPQSGQTSRQQAKDEAECRAWAKQKSGIEPSAPPPQAKAWSNARGIVGGAARVEGRGYSVE
jgi:hypothetical protein